MAYKNCIIRIPGTDPNTAQTKPAALLTAVDKALEEKTYEVLDCTEIHEITHSDPGKFFTYLLLEIDENDHMDIFDRISEMISYACSLETVETSDSYCIVAIDYCVYSFK
ncbi:hypothetical protein [uncultured Flavobacterium sp.]|uniref:hypothetical protein n=1 Tax=uncultured Flavobacterium sp. TaxID=165435 RepID=UPI0025CEA9FA|nr:hypothetical protein [uncultured Flavobacterium sp.]